MNTYGGLNIGIDFERMDFIYGDQTFGPPIEKRYLDDIRKTLKDPKSAGPDVVYSIAMDIGYLEDQEELVKRNLLYGACIYAKGKIGEEPVRSQGHIHAVSASCGSSTPEMYEIWSGEACIFMQESGKRDAKSAYAVHCRAGDKVIVPPGYAHYTVNACPDDYMSFGAWCVRDFGFDYKDVRANKGLMYFPVITGNKQIQFIHNRNYDNGKLLIKEPEVYHYFGLDSNKTIYELYRQDHDLFQFVTQPMKYEHIWSKFVP